MLKLPQRTHSDNPLNYGGYGVFRKTQFVQSRLTLLAEERGSADLEALQKSRFSTFVYIMEDSRTGTFKLGQSKTPGKRERTLQSEAPQIALRFSIPTNEAHEKHLHDQFNSKRIRGEWFSLTPNDLLQIVQFLKANGDIPRAFVDNKWLGEIYFKSGIGH